MSHPSRFTAALAAFAIFTTASSSFSAETDVADIKAEIAKRHDEGVKRLQDWIKLPSIAAEDLGFPEGPDYMMNLLTDAGFQKAEKVATDGKPAVFAILDAGYSDFKNASTSSWLPAVMK